MSVFQYGGRVRPRDLCCYGLVTWRHNDGILRLYLHEPKLWWNLASYHKYNVSFAFAVYMEICIL